MPHDDEFRDRDYPVQEFMRVQQRHWRLERIGWVVFLLIVLLTALGGFSKGALSLTTARSADGALTVDYQRFERNSAASEITVRLQGEPGEVMQLELTGDLLDKFSIEGIQPEPLNSESVHGGLRWSFRTDQAGDATVYLALRVAGLGSAHSQLALTDTSRIAVDQFIYP